MKGVQYKYEEELETGRFITPTQFNDRGDGTRESIDFSPDSLKHGQ
jgi:hypothetical protein